MSITYREAMMANEPASKTPAPRDPAMPLWVFFTVAAVALLIVIGLIDHNRRNDPRIFDRCPIAKPGQVLIVTVGPRNADGHHDVTCRVVTSQGTVRERIAKAAQ
jgi:hypothetical protein